MSEYVPSQDDSGIDVLKDGVKVLRDGTASTGKKFAVGAGMLAAIGYVVFPVDAVPDAVPLFGMLDDFGVMAAALLATLNTVKDKVSQPGISGLEKFLFLMGAAYAVAPVDVVPDAIPVVGTVDDVLIMLTVLLPWLLSLRGQSDDSRGSSRTGRHSSRTNRSVER